MRERKSPDGLVITHLFRMPRNRGMTDSVKCRGVHLTLVVSPRLNDEDPGDWRVAARAHQTLHGDLIGAQWGHTHREARSTVGRSWDAPAYTVTRVRLGRGGACPERCARALMLRHVLQPSPWIE